MAYRIVLMIVSAAGFFYVFNRSVDKVRDILKNKMQDENIGIILNNVYYGAILSTMPIAMVFSYNFFRVIQYYVIGSAGYIVVDGLAGFALAAGFFAFCFVGVIGEFFIGRPLFITTLGKEAGLKLYRKNIASDKDYKIIMKALSFFASAALIASIFCVFHYAKFNDSGITVKSWASFVKKFYTWDQINAVSQDKKDSSYKIYFYDAEKIVIYRDFREIHNRNDELVKFVLNKTQLSLLRK